MDFSDLIGNLLGQRKSQTIQTEPGQTYGPAMTRVSRTPISYGELPPGRSGEFYPDTKSIKVDPKKGNVPQITRHEEIHAILEGLPQEGAPQTTSAPEFMNIARVIQPQVAGEMQNEVPAYMGSAPTSGFYGISDAQRNAYVQGLAAQLQKLDPSIAAKFARLGGR